jgi:SAM-dependent methyltransferase/Gpi18-like mannosyltransferase
MGEQCQLQNPPVDRLSFVFRNWKIGYIIALGLIIRFIIAPFTAHPLDVYAWYETGENIVLGHGFYSNQFYTYMPIWFLTFTPFVILYNFLAPIVHAAPVSLPSTLINLGYPPSVPLVVDWLFAFIIKIPIFLCDVGVCLVLFRYVSRLSGSEQLGTIAGTAYFLSPFTIWISAFWGMFDALPVFLSLIAFVLLTEEKYELSGLFTGLAVAAKYFALLLVPVALIIILKKNPKRLRNYLLLLILPIALICLPFLILEPQNFVEAIINPVVGATMGRLNLWALLSLLNVKELPWVFAFIDVVLMALLYAFIWIKSYNNTETDNPTAFLNREILLNLFVFYFFFRVLNEQYLLWAQPFLIIEYSLHKSGKRLRNPGFLAFLFSGLRLGLLFLAPMLTISWAHFAPTIEFFAKYNGETVQALLNASVVFLWFVIVLILFFDLKNLLGEIQQTHEVAPRLAKWNKTLERKFWNGCTTHSDSKLIWNCFNPKLDERMFANKRVLNAGCGATPILIKAKCSLLVNLDLSVTQLKKLKMSERKTMAVVGDLENLPFREGSFDYALCIQVLHHTKVEKSLNALKHSLKKEGSIISVDINKYNIAGVILRLTYRCLSVVLPRAMPPRDPNEQPLDCQRLSSELQKMEFSETSTGSYLFLSPLFVIPSIIFLPSLENSNAFQIAAKSILRVDAKVSEFPLFKRIGYNIVCESRSQNKNSKH